jgi:hypothetical protein
MNDSTNATKIVEQESGGEDAFLRAARTEPAPLKSKYVSSSTVAVGEGVKFAVDALEIVEDRFEKDGSTPTTRPPSATPASASTATRAIPLCFGPS